MVNTKQNILKLLEEICKIKALIQQKDIILLTNTRNKTQKMGNLEIQFADETEFFKEEEFDEILEGLKEEDFFVKSYFNELNFIHDVIEEKISSENIIVYNLARNGNKEGKKSLIPSFCDLLNIPYTGSNAFAISLCRNKYIFSKILETHNIPTPKCWLYLGDGRWADNKPISGIKIIAKPTFESASIGLSNENVFIYSNDSEPLLQKLYNENHKKPILLQDFIEGYECEVPFFVHRIPCILDPVGIVLNNKGKHLGEQILTAAVSESDKYSFYLLADIVPNTTIDKIVDYCKQIAIVLGIKNYGRIDFRIDNNFNVYVTDIAASPYTTKHSSMAYIFERYDINYSTIYTMVLGCKMYDYFIGN